ncbi:MAG: cysteine desulfurase [Candidatus Niyogibacteria bacterium]|nr:cysteine desulfurase [Candidatus Niyogibacteria bacterium]
MKNNQNQKLIYLDYAASTPVDAEVVSAMAPYWTEEFGNPGSLHFMGQEARRVVDDAREKIKKFVNADSLRNIIFTGSATEADNMAVYGAARGFTNSHRLVMPHIITTAIEHEAVLESCRDLEKNGLARVTYLKAGKDGIVDVADLENALSPETALVSIMYANNEIGAIQPIAEIAEIIHQWKKFSGIVSDWPLIHTDAVQAAGFLNMDARKLGVDLLTISGHKIYGPKGVGALYVRDGINIYPWLRGGGQEYGMRAGTEPVPLIVGLGRAVELAEQWKSSADNIKNMLKSRDHLLDKLLTIPGVALNGSRERRLPNNINVALTNRDFDTIMIGLSQAGVCVSSGSACAARGQKPSHVILALGCDEKRARSSLRVTLGKYTTEKELDDFYKILQNMLK